MTTMRLMSREFSTVHCYLCSDRDAIVSGGLRELRIELPLRSGRIRFGCRLNSS